MGRVFWKGIFVLLLEDFPIASLFMCILLISSMDLFNASLPPSSWTSLLFCSWSNPFPLPAICPCHPNFFWDVQWKEAYPSSAFVLLSKKTPPRSISVLIRQASLSLSHLGSPCLCLLQAKSILFGCWWPEAHTALLVDICHKRRRLATAACCLS